jgi:probable phosphoglycerate mutase
MVDIVLVRHGETDWNVEKRMQGHIDIPLNATGVQQAEALGRAVASESFDAVFSSDLQRALQTASQIAVPRGLTVVQDAGLRERCFGAFEGLRPVDIETNYPQDYARWRTLDINARFPAGERVAETLQEFYDRVTTTFNRLVNAGQFHKVAIVAHGGVLDALYRYATGMALNLPRNFEMLNASINRLVWEDGQLRVVTWSDVTHLGNNALDEVDRQGQ